MDNLLLVDLDGTVRKPISDNVFIQHPEDQQIIPEAALALDHYYKEGWTILGITNQGGVAAGKKSPQDALREQQITLQLCEPLSAIIFCPDFEGEMRLDVMRPDRLPSQGNIEELHSRFKGQYRKPGPGMLLYAIAWLNADKANTLYTGDRQEDFDAAANAGINFLWVQDWYDLEKTYGNYTTTATR